MEVDVEKLMEFMSHEDWKHVIDCGETASEREKAFMYLFRLGVGSEPKYWKEHADNATATWRYAFLRNEAGDGDLWDQGKTFCDPVIIRWSDIETVFGEEDDCQEDDVDILTLLCG